MFYYHLVHFVRIHLVHFFQFWYPVPRKIWQSCAASAVCLISAALNTNYGCHIGRRQRQARVIYFFPTPVSAFQTFFPLFVALFRDFRYLAPRSDSFFIF
jgi:hypothetical protein